MNLRDLIFGLQSPEPLVASARSHPSSSSSVPSSTSKRKGCVDQSSVLRKETNILLRPHLSSRSSFFSVPKPSKRKQVAEIIAQDTRKTVFDEYKRSPSYKYRDLKIPIECSSTLDEDRIAPIIPVIIKT